MKMTENNRMLKLIALAIAIVLWLYVGTQQDPLAQHTYEVQLEMEIFPSTKPPASARRPSRFASWAGRIG